MATDGDELPIDNLIDSMEQKITSFEKGENSDRSPNVKSSSMFSSIKTYKYYWTIYLIVPIFIMILLLVLKPNFIQVAQTNEEGVQKAVVNYKRVFIVGAVLGSILDVTIFLLLKKLG